MSASIIPISLGNLKNETHAEFHENVKITIEKADSKMLFDPIDYYLPLYENYIKSYENEQEALNFIRKSELTAKISEQDSVRDAIFRGLSDAIKSYRNHFEAEKRVAANKLWSILLHYGNIAKKTLDDQTAAVSDILREFKKPELANAIDFLKLNEWIVKLEEENNKFRDLMTERYNEPIGKTTYRMSTARVETDKYYRAMTMLFNSRIIAGEKKTDFKNFIKELNAVIKRFKDILAQDFGRKNAAATAASPVKESKIVTVEKLEDGKFQVTKE